MVKTILSLSLSLALTATFLECNTTPKVYPVLLISLDGFRWDYPEKTDTPNFHRLIQKGVRAKRMLPVFPSKTFSNHYSIVTGLFPENHGIVSNSFYDPKMQDAFSYRSTKDNEDSKWWGGEPIWVTAEKQGLKSASFFWPGAQAKIGGIDPTYLKKYDGKIRNESRIDTVLSWLQKPEKERPSVITCYFARADETGHEFGPDTPEMSATIAHLDSIIGRLIHGLEAASLWDEVNIIIVSDHGMASTSSKRVIFLEDFLDVKKFRISMETPFVGIRTSEDSIDYVFNKLDKKNPHMRILRKNQMPSEYHFSKNDRIAEVICLADEGWSITTRDYFNKDPKRFDAGTHGYDNFLPSMGATFIACGPSFKKNVVIEPFLNIHIYDLIAELLKINPAPNDGSLDSLRHILQ